MAISTYRKSTIYRNLYENTGLEYRRSRLDPFFPFFYHFKQDKCQILNN